MRVTLDYGRDGVEVAFSDAADVTLIRKPTMPLIEDSGAAITQALAHPVGCEPLGALAAACASADATACIAICDITRPVPNGLFLRPMIDTLISAGIAADNISVVVATGLHRPNEGDELEELIGDPWVSAHVRVENHFARDDAAHVYVGNTRERNTVVKLDKRFVEADLRIVTGLVEPHFMAGYSGGRKVIAPGLAHAETITTFHSSRFMSDPLAANCNLTGNPLHEEQLEIVSMLGDVYALNTVIDDRRRLSFVNFGEVVASHAAAVDFVRDYCEVDVPRRFKTVVTSCAGYPLDKTYYQTVKGMVAAQGILEPGGELVIASQCSEGMGSEEFVQAQRRLCEQGADAFLAAIAEKTHADIDEWQTQMQTKPMRIGTVKLYSEGLSAAQSALTGVERVTDLSQAVAESIERSGDNAVAVIPEGPYVVPSCRASA